MTRKLKGLGLALIAALALGSIGMAQAASAEVTHTFTSASTPTILTAEGEGAQTLVGGPLTVHCQKLTAAGTQTGTAVDTTTLRPEYSECITTPNIATTVTNHGCAYVFDSDTNTSADLTGEHATVSLECEHMHNITIAAAGCSIEFGDTHTGGVSVNQNLFGVTYTNIANGDVTVTSTIKTIKYIATGANCALIGLKNGETYSNGTYNGTAVVSGWGDTKFSGTLTSGFSIEEGNAVNLEITTP